jgi:hypothetical protein
MTRELSRIFSILGLSLWAVILPLSPARSGPLVERLMEEARKAAQSRKQLVFTLLDANRKSHGLLVVHNNLKPFGFCFWIGLQGEWYANETGGAHYVTDSGASSVAFTVLKAEELEAAEGADNYEKAVFILEAEYARLRASLGLSGDSATSRAWLDGVEQKVLTWRLLQKDISAHGNPYDRFTMQTASHYLMAVPGGQMLNVTVIASSRNREDAMARQFLDSFRTTQDPECFFPALPPLLESLEK